MHYFRLHINDYAQATAHLSMVEDAAYTRLLRKYYADERPLPADIDRLQRLVGARTREEKNAVKTVLEEFFFRDGDFFRNKRADEELAEYASKSLKAKESANARWMRTHSDGIANEVKTQSVGNANHKPITNNQEPLTNVKERERTSALVCPSDVREEVWNDWIALRRQKKAIVTDRVVRTVRNEASKAGMSLDAALEMACARGWQGFSADWIAKGSKDGWSRRMQGFDNTIDMETSNGQVPVLPEDSVPF